MNSNKTSFVTSINKAINKAKSAGNFDTYIPRLFKAYSSNIEYIDGLNDAGITDLNHYKKKLQTKLVDLRAKYPNEICLYSNVIEVAGCTSVLKPGTTVIGSSGNTYPNTAPTVLGVTIPLLEKESYTFKESDFTNSYSDAEGDLPFKLIIYISSSEGIFKFDGKVINTIFELNINDVHKLTYTRKDDSVFSDIFNFRISDMSPNSKYSVLTTNTLTGTLANNLPATIGDNTIYVDNNVTTVLTLDMFTNDTNTAYYDPEGDLIDAIRIDRLHSTNVGTFYLNGIQISNGQIITREQLSAGEFTHLGVDLNSIGTDGFEFSARDEGSKVWIN